MRIPNLHDHESTQNASAQFLSFFLLE